MPVILPNGLPANERLLEENIFVMSPDRARTQDIRPLRMLALNLMPTKITTETQIARLLANSPLQVELTLLQTASLRGRHVSGDHLDAFYKTFDEVKNERFDGMIITGAPVEQLDFHEVNYWEELKGIFDWSLTHAYSTLHVCWGAFAALWYHYGIRKRPLAEKLFGIFEHEVLRPSNPLVRGFDDRFFVPHSRHTGLNLKDLAAVPALRVLASGRRTGPYLLSTENGRQIFVTGHPEYDLFTLDAEYRRDLEKGLAISVPENYYPSDDPAQRPINRWRSHAHLLYHNWLNYYVYQTTPYDLEELSPLAGQPH